MLEIDLPSADSKVTPALSERRLVAYVAIGLIVAVICAYALIVCADFIDYDDNNHVFENPVVVGGLSWAGIRDAFTKYYASLWLPLTWISFMADVSLFGMNPGAMHAVNLAWHVAATALLFLTLRRMTGSLWGSAFVAALFGLHPLNVESVAWVTERKNVLSTFFWIAAIAAYARYAEKPRASSYSLTLLMTALALLAKPMAATLPCTLLLLDFWPLRCHRTVSWQRLALEKLPFFLIAAISCWLTICAQRTRAVVPLETITLAGRASNAFMSYATYLGQFFWPVNLGVFYPHPVDPQPLLAGAALLLIMAITGFAGWAWKRHPYVLIGWLWYLGTLVPVIGLMQVGSQARADRFTYVPQIGIFIAVVWLVKDCWPKSPRVMSFAAAAALLACALLTARQVSYWMDGATLFEHTIAVTGDNACAYANAGLHRARAGDPVKAIEHFQASLRIKPDQAMIWREFGAALATIEKPKEAIEALRMALQYDPADFGARYKLGMALESGGATDEAIAQFREILAELPHSAGSHFHLALALEKKGLTGEALAHLNEAARLAPADPQIRAALHRMEPPSVAADSVATRAI